MRCIFAILCLAICGCGAKATVADTADAATAADTAIAPEDVSGTGDIGAGIACGTSWTQGYCIQFSFHGQKYDGRSFTLERDLTGTSDTVVFGDSHMQPPAVSLALHDTWQLGPYKDLVDFNLVFGNLVNAPGFVPFVPQVADYPFSCKPPYFEVTYGTNRYRSTCPGLTGDINVTTWTATPGHLFAGHFSGHLQQYLSQAGGDDDCLPAVSGPACKSAVSTVDVDGTFGITLPGINSATAP